MKELSNSGLYDVKNYADLGGLFVHILLDLHSSVFTPYSTSFNNIIVNHRHCVFVKFLFQNVFRPKHCIA